MNTFSTLVYLMPEGLEKWNFIDIVLHVPKCTYYETCLVANIQFNFCFAGSSFFSAIL